MRSRFSFGLLLACAAGACATGACAGRTPAPAAAFASTTEQDPEAADEAHRSALLRLLHEPWGWRNDKQDTLHVALPDWERWRRVRFYGVPTLVGFRYGDDHDAVIAVWVQKVEPGDDGSAEMCLDRFESWAEPQAMAFGVEITESETVKKRWARGEVVIQTVEAVVDSILGRRSYAAAYGAYAMWPNTCTVAGLSVLKKGSNELARQVRDRYVREGLTAIVQNPDRTPDF